MPITRSIARTRCGFNAALTRATRGRAASRE